MQILVVAGGGVLINLPSLPDVVVVGGKFLQIPDQTLLSSQFADDRCYVLSVKIEFCWIGNSEVLPRYPQMCT